MLRILICSLLLSIVSAGSLPGQADQTEASLRAARLRARVYLEKKQWYAAQQELLKLAEKFPKDQYILSDLATVYHRQGKADEAETTYRRLLELFPEVIVYRQDFSYFLHERGRYNEALEFLAPLIKDMAQADTSLLMLAADSYFRAGLPDMAEEIYHSLLQKYPSQVSVLLLIAESYLGRNQPREARSYFERAHGLETGNYRALKGMGISYFQSDPEKSRKYLLEALPLNESGVSS